MTSLLPITRPRRVSTPSTRRSTLRQHPKHRLSSSNSSPNLSSSERSSQDSPLWSDASSDSEAPPTPATDIASEGLSRFSTDIDSHNIAEVDVTQSKKDVPASTKLVTQDPDLLSKTVGDGESGTQLIQKYCCGGGCCFLTPPTPESTASSFTPLTCPDSQAFKSLNLKLGNLSASTQLTNTTPLSESTVSFSSLADAQQTAAESLWGLQQPPKFVQPHVPYDVFSAPLYHVRELTKTGAQKRTFHFDIDVTDYPEEGDVDFKVGGAVGICPPNAPENVDEIFDVLGVPRYQRDRQVQLQTSSGRWPTVWGDEKPRTLLTSRRELLTWCSDIQSYPPTKTLLRLLAAHATAENEKKILLYLCSTEGQASFCDLRTGSHLSVAQLLHAFPSSKPPLPDLLSQLSQLMPRFYSLSNDPHVSSAREGLAGRRLIEIAVTVHETPDWRGEARTGVGSGYLERIAQTFIAAEQAGEEPRSSLRIPMFRGLMANPLSAQFGGATDGPMMLIGAGVGMAPFRGFILNRLRNANCASKIWLVQGVRDSSVDELYSGELGRYETQIKKVVQSRGRRKGSVPRPGLELPSRIHSENDLPTLSSPDRGSGKSNFFESIKNQESRYVQDEVRNQADIVWQVINAVDGRVFVCGSSKGMGEGVEDALRHVVKEKGGMDADQAKSFWDNMREQGKLVTETW
ncbi:MAG: hypothetical protein M1828_000323 [Chrysothrix sp. TS-e1954]|nr:MAG: hypothetical protein M1828_000323 [Chrysothrix sp. TS-e1954]